MTPNYSDDSKERALSAFEGLASILEETLHLPEIDKLIEAERALRKLALQAWKHKSNALVAQAGAETDPAQIERFIKLKERFDLARRGRGELYRRYAMKNWPITYAMDAMDDPIGTLTDAQLSS